MQKAAARVAKDVGALYQQVPMTKSKAASKVVQSRHATAQVVPGDPAGTVQFIKDGRIEITGPLAIEIARLFESIEPKALAKKNGSKKPYRVYSALIRVHNPDVIVDARC